MNDEPMRVTHIAGTPITINSRTAGQLIRQLCGWCGFELIDYDTALMAVPVGHEGPPATWETGALVNVGGDMAYVVEHRDGDDLPPDSCTYAHRDQADPVDRREADPCEYCACHTATECRERRCDKATCPG